MSISNDFKYTIIMKIPEVVLRTQTNYTLSQSSVYLLNIS